MAYQIAGLALNALVPIVVVIIGWKLNQRLKEIEQSQWANQKLVEKRLMLFDEIMPRLNDLYCFYMFVGHWKDITPLDVIEAKRFLDQKVIIYTAILGRGFWHAYERFTDTAFVTFAAEPGKDGLIRCVIEGLSGDRSRHSHYQWDPDWDCLFPQPASFNKVPFQHAYDDVVRAFQRSIGIVTGELKV